MSDSRRAIEAAFRIEFPRLVARLARIVGSVSTAEELAADTLVVALERWPVDGVPDDPRAWLTTIAKRKAIDRVRHLRIADDKHAQLAHEPLPDAAAERLLAQLDDDIGDDLLRLMFVACHPVLPTEARVALTLRLVGGLTTAEIARAFVISEAAIAQRIVRAKQALAMANVAFEVPLASERPERLASVLEAIYLVFNEGHVATAGEAWTRPALCLDALRIARVLAGLVPDDPEVHALVALLELTAARLPARESADGTPVLLADQDRSRWDPLLIRRGLAALARAEELCTQSQRRAGPYQLQAAIAAHHSRAVSAELTAWPRIAALYTALALIAPSPVVDLNRAVALGMAFGPAVGLELIDQLLTEPSLAGYHLLPAVRAEFLGKLGRTDEARVELERAAALTHNERERAVLLERATRTSPR